MGRTPGATAAPDSKPTTTIDRREWGLEWNQTLETGGILVGNKIDIDLGVQAVQTSDVPEEEHAGTR